MTQLTFQMDTRSEDALAELQELLDSKSKASALRYALELARIVANEIKDNKVTIKNKDTGQDIQIAILGG